MGKLLLIACLLISIDLASAATIYGSIYDLSLNKVDNVRVEITTLPRQHYVAKNGSYSFNVPAGSYTIKAVRSAENIVEIAKENISIKDEGNYVLDLIMFPSFEEEKELLKETGVSIRSDSKSGSEAYYSFITAILILVSIFSGYSLYRYIQNKKPAEEAAPKIEPPSQENAINTNTDEIIRLIKEEGGRTTQKDIRKKIPLSEAKISLMITELEEKGSLKKIKKGRGNILILNK